MTTAGKIDLTLILSYSCMIARNLLNGLKTCWEVFQYMNNFENKLSLVSDGMNGIFQGSFKGDGHTIVGNQPQRKSRFLHRRGRVRRLKYTGKSAGYNALRKRISERKDKLRRHYNPCNCQVPCGKECPCIVNGTLCEKYCGECDPDVCRNCWISCGDGTLDIPPQRSDSNDCENMKLLLKQRQRVLLGRSDVSGWGAFLKCVLDAYRKGDKLKFANHSPDPNCYPKVIAEICVGTL
uniref:CXC domain-containing protein n=1 Tax=Solanum lycopersicum TaxID=4081 RepID=A0A3Q7FZN7_SOLLC